MGKRRLRKAYVRRAKVKGKGYIKTIPPLHIVRFVMGDARGFYEKKYPLMIDLLSSQKAEISDVSLEACRKWIHKELEETLKGNYYFAISAYPHHVLRENKMLVGVAQADRMQTGMSLSFGKPVGIAAKVKPGSKIFTIAVRSEKEVPLARTIYKRVKPKLGCRTTVKVSELKL